MKLPLRTYREWLKRQRTKKQIDRMIAESKKNLRPDLVPVIITKTDCVN